MYLLFNNTMNLITKLGLDEVYFKTLNDELIQELNIVGDFLFDSYTKIKTNNAKDRQEAMKELEDFFNQYKKGMDKNRLIDKLAKMFLFFNNAMNLITKLGLSEDFIKTLNDELIQELNLVGDFLLDSYIKINNIKDRQEAMKELEGFFNPNFIK